MSKPQFDISAAEMVRLVREVANNDREAFARLFNYFAPRIKAMAMRGGMDAAAAEDVAQDTMLAVWRKAHLYVGCGGGVAAWIYTIARNRRIDLARATRRAATHDAAAEGDAAAERADDSPAPDAVLESAQRADQVKHALDRLTADQQRVIRLSFFENRSHSEIVAALGIPLGTVKSRIRLAFQRLRDLLDETQ